MDAEIRVEYHPTTIPRPVGFCVFRKGKLVGVLTRDQVEKALTEFKNASEVDKCVSLGCKNPVADGSVVLCREHAELAELTMAGGVK